MRAGAGNLAQTIVLVVLLAITGQTHKTGFDRASLEGVWRGQYCVAVVILFGLTVYRFLKLKESAQWEATPQMMIIPDEDAEDGVQPKAVELTAVSLDDKAKAKEDGEALAQPQASPKSAQGDIPHKTSSVGPHTAKGCNDCFRTRTFAFLGSQWHRLFGTSIGWLVWDVAFYGNLKSPLCFRHGDSGYSNRRLLVNWILFTGNKLFQGRFIKAIYGSPSVFVVLQWTMLNSAIALVGTPLAACSTCVCNNDNVLMCRCRLLRCCFHDRQALDGSLAHAA